MSRKLLLPLLAALVFFSVAATRRRAVQPPKDVPLSLARSFAVTDKPILAGFSFERVMDALAARSGVPGTTGGQLIRQMFDTQNPKPGKADPAGPHCDDFLVNGKPTFNGFPRRCPTAEGALAQQPFAAGEYMTTALMNRFDQAPPDGANCGQYRMIFARPPLQPGQRIHLIFEAVLPNPHPEQGLTACRPVAEFWAGLSLVDSMSERRARLEKFYFDGISGFEPVVAPEHYGAALGGGIRTRQALAGPTVRGPRMYQFRIAKECTAPNDCVLRLVPDTLENLPFGDLFDARVDTPTARALRDEFVKQVPTLAVNDVNLYSMKISRDFLMVESDPVDSELAFAFDTPFIRALSTDAGKAYRDRIQAELTRIGSDLTPLHIIQRAESQNCVGCHTLSGPVGGGVVFPASEGLEQVQDLLTESGEGGPESRFRISRALRDVFIPHRMEILRQFLATGKAPVHSN
jgi:hypothetical protein